MESPCPSVMLMCAAGSKGNGRIQSRQFALKVHNSWGRQTCFSSPAGKYEGRQEGNKSLWKGYKFDNTHARTIAGVEEVRTLASDP